MSGQAPSTLTSQLQASALLDAQESILLGVHVSICGCPGFHLWMSGIPICMCPKLALICGCPGFSRISNLHLWVSRIPGFRQAFPGVELRRNLIPPCSLDKKTFWYEVGQKSADEYYRLFPWGYLPVLHKKKGSLDLRGPNKGVS